MSSAELVVAAPPRRPRLWLRSLSSKLVAGVVALVLLLVMLVGGLTWYALRAFLDSRLDQQLQAASAGSLNSLFNGSPQNGPGLRGPQDVWAAALSPSGTLIAYPNNTAVEKLLLTSGDRQRLAAQSMGKSTNIETTDGQHLLVTTRRAVATPVATGQGQEAIIVIGLSTDEEHSTLHRLVVAELIIGAGALVLAFGATFYGVQRSLRNLYQVTGTAREVAAELSPEGAGLDRRVPLVEEGTEVGRLAESMNTLLSAVETQFKARVESEQRMRQFLADASHELRTPLTSIRGYAELARMQRAAGDDAADNLHRIESEGTRMSRLVEDLMMLARTDSAENARAVEREPVEIVGLLDDVASASHAAFPERRIEVSPLPVPIVVGDRDQLLRVVRNLVTNACVHTRPEAPIMLRCYPNAGGAEIQVIDGGPGLPPEDAAHVFERFWRADKARTRARGGSGLGLSIVDTIIRAHGGAVRFDSSVETGSTVTVWLPPAGPQAFDAEPDLSEADVLASD